MVVSHPPSYLLTIKEEQEWYRDHGNRQKCDDTVSNDHTFPLQKAEIQHGEEAS